MSILWFVSTWIAAWAACWWPVATHIGLRTVVLRAPDLDEQGGFGDELMWREWAEDGIAFGRRRVRRWSPLIASAVAFLVDWIVSW